MNENSIEYAQKMLRARGLDENSIDYAQEALKEPRGMSLKEASKVRRAEGVLFLLTDIIHSRGKYSDEWQQAARRHILSFTPPEN